MVNIYLFKTSMEFSFSKVPTSILLMHSPSQSRTKGICSQKGNQSHIFSSLRKTIKYNRPLKWDICTYTHFGRQTLTDRWRDKKTDTHRDMHRQRSRDHRNLM